MKHRFFAYDKDFYNSYLGFRSDIDKIRQEVSKKEISEIRKITEEGLESTEKLYYIENRKAHIPIIGSLTNKLDICAELFGIEQTLYNDIIEQTRLADEDSEVDEIIYDVDTPGGAVDGVELAAEEIRKAKKPTTAIVYNLAASAGMWLISGADKILSADRTAEFGSIGVVVEFYNYSKRDAEEGVERISITSTDAPDKRIDLTTEDGQQKLRSRLDDIHSIFAETVAVGRKTTVKNVNENYGKGGVMIAEKALAAGMIDGIIIKGDMPNISAKTNNKTPQGDKTMEESMTKDKIKAESPDIYDEIKNEGKTEAVAAAMSNVKEILALAGISADIATQATSGIDSGEFAKAELKKQREANAKADDLDLGKITPQAQTPKDTAPKDTAPEGKKDKEAKAEAKIDAELDAFYGKEAE